MDELIEKYLNRVKLANAEATHETFSVNLKQFDQWVDENGYDVRTLGPLDVEGYFLWLKSEGYAPNTIASRFESVRGLYNFLSQMLGAVEENPMRDLRRRDYVDASTKKHDESDIVYVTPEEMEALCEHVPSPKLRNELVLRLLWQTGVRKSELVNIELSHIDREERSIRVWSNKSKKTRTVFYQPSLDLLMDQWIDGGYRSSYTPAENSPYLFVTERSEKLSTDTINMKIVRPAADAAGIQEVMYQDQSGANRYRITPHALRHGHAVHALKSGIDLRTVQKALGHSNLDMTMKYLQLLDDDVKQGYRRFGMVGED